MPGTVAKRRASASARSTIRPSVGLETTSKNAEIASKSDIGALDDAFSRAGLVRSRRGKSAGVVPCLPSEPVTPQELSPTPPIPRGSLNGVEWLSLPKWDGVPWLWHGFSTRLRGVSRAYCPEDASGELNLGFTPHDDRDNVLRNRALFAEALTGSSATPLATLRQIHSSVILIGGSDAPFSEAGKPLGRGDGLMTDRPGVLLGIQTADCIPVLVADRKRRAVAAFHAGWRGTVKRIVENGIGRMRMEFGSRPEDLLAAIGPGNLVCCYQVGEDVLSEFESQFSYGHELFREVYDADAVRSKYPLLFMSPRPPAHSPAGPSLHVDLVEANRRQLLAAGVPSGSIHVVAACTHCHPELFFSHRGSHGRCGRMMSVIGIKPRLSGKE